MIMLDYELGDHLPVHDHGYVALLETMGSDEAIVDAARISYDRRGKSEDRALIRYLLRHRHCYHEDMQVLTRRGWVYWKNCKRTEVFAVPHPKTKHIRFESCSVNMFDVNEELLTFDNERMSYAVTSDHRMWFKGKYQKSYKIIQASAMSKWGHFDPLVGYAISQNEPRDPFYELAGFILGDGCWENLCSVSFHLKKERKKEYLRNLFNILKISWTENPSSTYGDAVVFRVNLTDTGISNIINPGERSKDKQFRSDSFLSMTESQIRGAFNGLVNSDGSHRKDRPQIEFSSTSSTLLDQFQTLACFLGLDCHGTLYNTVISYNDKTRTSLESRKQYHGTMRYRGKVCCATTSTGLLIVRGGPDKFGFICGNTSPFEMGVMRFEDKMPIFVARQWIRHRTASLNELSARYTKLPNEMFVPQAVAMQSVDNK